MKSLTTNSWKSRVVGKWWTVVKSNCHIRRRRFLTGPSTSVKISKPEWRHTSFPSCPFRNVNFDGVLLSQTLSVFYFFCISAGVKKVSLIRGRLRIVRPSQDEQVGQTFAPGKTWTKKSGANLFTETFLLSLEPFLVFPRGAFSGQLFPRPKFQLRPIPCQ